MHLTPGQLREAVAREIMGWRLEVGIEMPEYESSIEAAFAVVAKMREKGYWCQMRNQFQAVARADCWAGFTPLGVTGWNGVPDNWTLAETVPLAICNAALAAIRSAK